MQSQGGKIFHIPNLYLCERRLWDKELRNFSRNRSVHDSGKRKRNVCFCGTLLASGYCQRHKKKKENTVRAEKGKARRKENREVTDVVGSDETRKSINHCSLTTFDTHSINKILFTQRGRFVFQVNGGKIDFSSLQREKEK